MNYGLYLSATGVLSSSYRQDVIANNLANSETTGFKRDLAVFTERRTEARERGLGSSRSNPLLEGLTGGMFAAPTMIDHAQGDMEPTGRNFDCAIDGAGFFMVDDRGAQRLTRNGAFILDSAGRMVLSDGRGTPVLDAQRKPIVLDGRLDVSVGKDGTISQAGQPVARLGVFEVPDAQRLSKHGGTLINHPEIAQARLSAASTVHGGFLERSNVDPATELSQLMSAQRELEANANMIRYQDQTLARLVNDVAKIS